MSATTIAPAASHPAAIRVQSQGAEVFVTVCDRAGYRTLLILSAGDARAVAAALFNRAADADTRAQAQAQAFADVFIRNFGDAPAECCA